MAAVNVWMNILHEPAANFSRDDLLKLTDDLCSNINEDLLATCFRLHFYQSHDEQRQRIADLIVDFCRQLFPSQTFEKAKAKKTMSKSSHPLHFKSPDIPPNSTIDPKFTCDGQDLQPQFRWCQKGIPKGTQSLTLIVDDPDAIPVVGSIFTHFAVTNIPSNLPSEVALSKGIVMKNDFGEYKWGGPCPPVGDPPHRYRFTLYALDIKTKNPRSTKLTTEIFERSYGKNILTKSQFAAFYQRTKESANAK